MDAMCALYGRATTLEDRMTALREETTNDGLTVVIGGTGKTGRRVFLLFAQQTAASGIWNAVEIGAAR
jgi:hypothetical protein